MPDPSPERSAVFARPWMARFLKAYKKYRSVSHACRAVHKGRTTVWRHKRTDPKFRAAWEEIEETITDDLEAALVTRCMKGVRRPVNLGVHGIEYVRDYPDNIAWRVLASRRPYPYNRASGDTGTGRDAQDTAREIRELVAKMRDSIPTQPAPSDETPTSPNEPAA